MVENALEQDKREEETERVVEKYQDIPEMSEYHGDPVQDERVKQMIEQKPEAYFMQPHLFKQDPQSSLFAAQQLLEQEPSIFFSYQLHKQFPKLALSYVKQYTELHGIEWFLANKFHTMPEFKDLTKQYVMDTKTFRSYDVEDLKIFFGYDLHKMFPELAKRWVRHCAPNELFGTDLHKYVPHDWLKEIVKGYRFDLFFSTRFDLYKMFPDMVDRFIDGIGPEWYFEDPGHRRIPALYKLFPQYIEKYAPDLGARMFFERDLHKRFPDLAKQKLRNMNSTYFFTDRMENKYELEGMDEIAREHADKLLDTAPMAFIRNNLHKRFPELGDVWKKALARIPFDRLVDEINYGALKDVGDSIIEGVIAETLMDGSKCRNSRRIFDDRFLDKFEHIYDKYIDNIHPTRFFNSHLDKRFPHHIETMIEKELLDDPRMFFWYRYEDKYKPILIRNIDAITPVNFFEYGVQDILPERTVEMAKQLHPFDFMRFKLYKESKELESLGSEVLAKPETDANEFFSYELHAIYPDLGKKLVENLSPEAFFGRKLQDVYPEIGMDRAKDMKPWLFFINKLHLSFPAMARKNKAIYQHAKEMYPHCFFCYEADKTLPELGYSKAKEWAETSPTDYLRDDASKRYLDITEPFAKELLEEGKVGDFFSYGLQKAFKEMARPYAEKLLEEDSRAFLRSYGLTKYYPEFKRDIIRKQKQWDRDNPDTPARPAFGKQYAKELYESGSGLFIHVGSYNSLKNVNDVVGEICVTSWDKAKSMFRGEYCSLAVLYRGQPSHMFKTDVYSSGAINDWNLRGLRHDKREESVVMNEESSYAYDEGWINPAYPEVELVGFIVVGDPDTDEYKEKLKEAEKLNDQHGVMMAGMSGKPSAISEMIERQEKPIFEDIEHPGEEWEKKYKMLPEMHEYSWVIEQMVKLATELDQQGQYEEADELDAIVQETIQQPEQVPEPPKDMPVYLDPAQLSQILARDGANGNDVLDFLEQDSELKSLLDGDALVYEGYTVREHTERVYDMFNDQAQYFNLENIKVDNINMHRLLEFVVAMHDIGKSKTTYEDKHRQHEFTVPIVMNHMHRLGFSEKEVEIATALLKQDALGDLVRNKTDLKSAYTTLTSLANKVGMSPADFFQLQSALYTVDAASYDYVRSVAFVELQNGQIVPKSREYQQLAKMMAAKEKTAGVLDLYRIAHLLDTMKMYEDANEVENIMLWLAKQANYDYRDVIIMAEESHEDYAQILYGLIDKEN